MLVHEVPVGFQDVDAAGIVFFPRFLYYCHAALEALLSALEGGHAGLITKHRLGVPTVHVQADYRSPLRYGDVARIELTVPHIGSRSFTVLHRITRGADGLPVAEIKQVVATTNLDQMRAVPIPSEVRAVLERHRSSTA